MILYNILPYVEKVLLPFLIKKTKTYLKDKTDFTDLKGR